MSNEEKPILKYDNIVVTSQGIAEVHGKKVVIFVPAGEIESVVLKFGRSDHRPVFSISIWIVLALVGIAGVIEFFRAMRGYRYELGMMAFGIIGTSMIFDTMKERYFFEVRAKKGISRLILSKHAQRTDIADFCNNLRTVYGYLVREAA